jgi:drug/metabolite transporter (DMT)-like permease
LIGGIIFNLFLLGTFSQTSLLIVFVALKYTTALDAAMLSILGTVLTIYAGHYFYKEKINSLIKTGLILASVGSVVVIIEPALADLQNHTPILHRIYGNLLTMFYNLIWVVYVVWSKMSTGEDSSRLKKASALIRIRPMHKKYSPIFLTALSL